MEKCKNCKHWSWVGGYKTRKTEQGLCEFMNGRIHLEHTNEPIRDAKNKSLVINFISSLSANICGIDISTSDSNLIHRHGWVWTDGGFSCAAFETK